MAFPPLPVPCIISAFILWCSAAWFPLALFTTTYMQNTPPALRHQEYHCLCKALNSNLSCKGEDRLQVLIPKPKFGWLYLSCPFADLHLTHRAHFFLIQKITDVTSNNPPSSGTGWTYLHKANYNVFKMKKSLQNHQIKWGPLANVAVVVPWPSMCCVENSVTCHDFRKAWENTPSLPLDKKPQTN